MYMFGGQTATTTAPRAGRRAAGGGGAGPIDPLGGPPPPPPVTEDTTALVDSKPSSPVDDEPNWLDELTDTAEKPKTTPTTAAAPVAATKEEPLTQQSTSIFRERGASNAGSVASSASLPPAARPAPTAAQPVPVESVAKSPTVATPAPVPASTAPPLATPSKPSTSVVYDDSTTLVATLEKELAEQEAALAAANASLEQVTRGSPLAEDDRIEETRERQISELEADLKRAEAAREQAATEKDTKLQAIETAKKEELEAIKKSAALASAAELDAKESGLQRDVAAQRGIVEALQREHDAMVAGASTPDAYNDNTASKLEDMMALFVEAMRKNFNANVKHMLSTEVRSVSQNLAEDRQSAREADRNERLSSLESYKTQREKAFDDFRQRRTELRRRSVDELFGRLKVKRGQYIDEMRERGGVQAKQKEMKLDVELQQSLVSTRQSLERVIERDAASLREQERTLQQRQADVEERLNKELEHEKTMLETEKDVLRRSMKVEDRFLGTPALDNNNPLSATTNDAIALSERMKNLADDVSMGLKAINASKTLPSSTQQLIDEREAVVEQLGQQIDSQKAVLDRDWLRLQNLLSTFEVHVNQFSKDISAGRAQLQSGQQKVDNVRVAWEQSMRSELGNGPTSSPSDEAVATVLVDAGSKLRGVTEKSRALAGTRRSNLRAMDATAEELAARQDVVSQLTLQMLKKYDELAKGTAFVETKASQLQGEQRALKHASNVLDCDREEIRIAAENVQHLARRLQADSEAVNTAYKENVAAMGNMALVPSRRSQRISKYQHLYQSAAAAAPRPRANLSSLNLHSPGNRTHGDFVSLMRFTDDAGSPGRYITDSSSSAEPQPPFGGVVGIGGGGIGLGGGVSSGGEGGGSLTTPSPDTGDEARRGGSGSHGAMHGGGVM